jgi:hypothetical protein
MLDDRDLFPSLTDKKRREDEVMDKNKLPVDLVNRKDLIVLRYSSPPSPIVKTRESVDSKVL